MAQRYCTNCGAELGDEARFCYSCGRPVHKTAAVSTPEADVSVPPAPQAGEEHRPRISLGQFVVGFLVVLVVLWLLIPTGDGSGGGGGNGGGGGKIAEQPQQKPAKREQGAKKQAQEQDKQPSADKQPAQAPESQTEPPAEPQPIKLSGTGSQATGFFELEEGLMVLDMAHQGEMNFIVTLLDEQGKEVEFAMGNAIGNVKISNAAHIQQAGRYILDVEADGPWQMTVRQPRPSKAPARTHFSGQGGSATQLFSMESGLKRIEFTHQGEMNFIVSLLDSEGRDVEFALANDIGTVKTSTTATILQDGIYLFEVEADGPWTIEIQ